MPWIIDYQLVLEQLHREHFRCLYYNSGAFGFAPDVQTRSIGWTGPVDPTIRPEARPLIRPVPEPFEANLAALTVRAWRDLLPGRVWVMPMSHWAYELEYGSREWLPAILEQIGVDPGLLAGRSNGAAVEFADHETGPFTHMLSRLLEMLVGSDFALAFPCRPVLCCVHHHKQLWWTSTDHQLIASLSALPGATERQSG